MTRLMRCAYLLRQGGRLRTTFNLVQFKLIMLTSFLLLALTTATADATSVIASSPQPRRMPLPPSFIRNAVGNATRSLNLDAKKVVEGGIHLAILAASVAGTVESIRTDEWEVIRRKRSSAEAGGGGSGESRIISKRRRAAQVGKLLGGYTPRIVFLAGMMLRSVQCATVLRFFFDPSLGFAAGASLAASFAKREWLKCILMGWGFGGVYWGLFRVHPPPKRGWGLQW
jgi:hypothetical protein